MATLRITHYKNKYTGKILLVKRSKHGHYFINQMTAEGIVLYSAFKRVSVKTVNSLIEDCKKVSLHTVRLAMALCVADSLTNSINPLKAYAEALEYACVKYAKRYYDLGFAYLKEYNGKGLYKSELKELYYKLEGLEA